MIHHYHKILVFLYAFSCPLFGSDDEQQRNGEGWEWTNILNYKVQGYEDHDSLNFCVIHKKLHDMNQALNQLTDAFKKSNLAFFSLHWVQKTRDGHITIEPFQKEHFEYDKIVFVSGGNVSQIDAILNGSYQESFYFPEKKLDTNKIKRCIHGSKFFCKDCQDCQDLNNDELSLIHKANNHFQEKHKNPIKHSELVKDVLAGDFSEDDVRDPIKTNLIQLSEQQYCKNASMEDFCAKNKLRYQEQNSISSEFTRLIARSPTVNSQCNDIITWYKDLSALDPWQKHFDSEQKLLFYLQRYVDICTISEKRSFYNDVDKIFNLVQSYLQSCDQILNHNVSLNAYEASLKADKNVPQKDIERDLKKKLKKKKTLLSKYCLSDVFTLEEKKFYKNTLLQLITRFPENSREDWHNALQEHSNYKALNEDLSFNEDLSLIGLDQQYSLKKEIKDKEGIEILGVVLSINNSFDSCFSCAPDLAQEFCRTDGFVKKFKELLKMITGHEVFFDLISSCCTVRPPKEYANLPPNSEGSDLSQIDVDIGIKWTRTESKPKLGRPLRPKERPVYYQYSFEHFYEESVQAEQVEIAPLLGDMGPLGDL